MTLITLRDMQWRARRIVIGLAATALVLAIAALLGALHDGFLDETDRTIDFFGADTWVVPTGVSGPFTSNSPMRCRPRTPVQSQAGVEEVTPVAIFRHVVEGAGAAYTDVNVIAYAPGGVVEPRIVEGRAPPDSGRRRSTSGSGSTSVTRSTSRVGSSTSSARSAGSPTTVARRRC